MIIVEYRGATLSIGELGMRNVVSLHCDSEREHLTLKNYVALRTKTKSERQDARGIRQVLRLSSVYHQYSVPTIFQVVTPISFLKKVILVSFLG